MLQWGYALNALAGFDPAEIKCGSHKRVHWICYNCPKGQLLRWTVSPNQRFHKKRGCPCCMNQKACKCNSLQTRCPEIAAEWDYSKNVKTPDNYLAYSKDAVWWTSLQRPSWQQSIERRTITRMRKGRQSAVPPVKRICTTLHLVQSDGAYDSMIGSFGGGFELQDVFWSPYIVSSSASAACVNAFC